MASAIKLRESEALKKAGLRISDPKQRRPLNELGEDWSLERIKEDCRLAFKKQRRGFSETSYVAECSPNLRSQLIKIGQVYVGWNTLEVTDYIDVTCCTKCQMFGHPERYCREKEPTCNMCGENSHRGVDSYSMCYLRKIQERRIRDTSDEL
ncbi:hypothetical protein EVAR_65185_1 [Eumeta japonica]|uniref:Uncharacterized protein n=1 Tax=Eumeta variegata TaxID=151549 RepID=A0A4C1ZKF8_EUMVA|nr:hypothetical protein EVAR_65185_1 [Eumeta japonica]